MDLLDFAGLAAVFAFAFLGGHIAQRTRQSVIVGYILAGVALGVMASNYESVGGSLFDDIDSRQVTQPIQVVFDLGITFLMFFIGMEISLKRLSRAGRSATTVAVIDTGFNLFAGVLIGTLMGWGWQDIFFLSGIILMSSLSVAAKALIELRRLDNRETEFLLSAMVVEAFIAMVLLTLSTSVIVVEEDGGPAQGVWGIAMAVAIVYITLILVAMFVVPHMARRIESIRHEEVFILLALGMIFSAAALSWYYGLPFMIGAFFMGIAFSETSLTERLHTRLMSLRDAFTAAFFVIFGMLINVQLLAEAETLVLIALAVPLIILNEMFFTATVSFFMGLSRREVINMGAALLGRGEDAILFASVGGGLKDAQGAHLLPQGMKLYPFAGGLCLIMSLLTPFVMKRSIRIADRLARAVPVWLRFGGTIVQRALAVELAPESHKRHGRPLALSLTVLAFFGAVLGLVATFKPDELQAHVMALGVGLLAWALLFLALRSRMQHLAGAIRLTDLHLLLRHRRVLADYVTHTISALLLMGLLVVALSPISLPAAMVAPPVFITAVLVLAKRVHRTAVEPPAHMMAQEMLEQQAEALGHGLRRRKGGDEW